MLINLKDLLKVANENNFAVPAFNISSDAMLKGVMKTCVKESSPVIVAIHPDELSYVGDSFVEMVKDMANKVDIPVTIHLDHGATLDQIQRAIRDGFTSVMIDSSLTSFENNVEITKEVIKRAHPVNVSVEAELGTIGTADENNEGTSTEIIYTRVEDAVEFVKETGCDALAVAIGTAHGLYPEGFDPHLKLDLLSEIKSAVDIPLVLHGGSSNPDNEIAEAVKRGINKVNISSDIKSAFYKKCREVLVNKQLREPNMIYPECIEAMDKVVSQKIHLFNSNDKANLY